MRNAIHTARIVVAALIVCAGIANAQTLDRSKPPVPGPAQPARFPDVQIRKLSNGITVAVVEDHEIPAVQIRAVATISPLLDPNGRNGLAELTAAMLAEGTTTMSAIQLAEAAAAIGSSVTPLAFYTLNRHVDRALSLMGDQLMRPAFPQPALDRLKATRLATLQRSKGDPAYLAGRIYAAAAYGAGHPYERTVTEASIGAITLDDVKQFHADYYGPQNISFVVGGDITPDQAVSKLERVFGTWKGGGKSGMPVVTPPPAIDSARILLYDMPGASQTLIFMGHAGPTRDTPDFFALQLVNAALGGGATSRLYRNIREKRGLTYAIASAINYRRKPQPGAFSLTSRVQNTKTDSALAEIVRELREVRATQPLTEEEIASVRMTQVRTLPRVFETVTQKVNAVAVILNDDLPLDYYSNISRNLEAVTLEHARAATSRNLDVGRMVIVLVGDRKLIEAPVRRLGIAPVIVVDENAKPIS